MSTPKHLLSESELRRQSAEKLEYLYDQGRATKADVIRWVRLSAKLSGRVYEPRYRPGGLGDRLHLKRREDAEKRDAKPRKRKHLYAPHMRADFVVQRLRKTATSLTDSEWYNVRGFNSKEEARRFAQNLHDHTGAMVRLLFRLTVVEAAERRRQP